MVSKQHTPQTQSLFAQTRGLLRHFNLRAKKSLGQHFLIDRGILEFIISAAELTATDIVMEVGPGLGVLTRELAKQAEKVIAIELDDKLANMLKQVLADCSNVVIVNKDVLETEPEVLLREQAATVLPDIGQQAGYKVVANLPYYITAPVLRHFLEARVKPKLMVVTVQKEVADAVAAKPGEMSLLSVSVQFYGKPRVVRKMPARCFYPEPAVDSAILRIDLYPRPITNVTDEEGFFELVRAGFSAPRKQLHNPLAQRLCLPKSEVLSLLDKASIAPQRRAETLSVDEWARLWQVYTETRT